jgi:hypothetical protein
MSRTGNHGFMAKPELVGAGIPLVVIAMVVAGRSDFA